MQRMQSPSSHSLSKLTLSYSSPRSIHRIPTLIGNEMHQYKAHQCKSFHLDELGLAGRALLLSMSLVQVSLPLAETIHCHQKLPKGRHHRGLDNAHSRL